MTERNEWAACILSADGPLPDGCMLRAILQSQQEARPLQDSEAPVMANKPEPVSGGNSLTLGCHVCALQIEVAQADDGVVEFNDLGARIIAGMLRKRM